MKIISLAAGLCLAACPAFAVPIATDQPVSIGDAQIVCTGVGSSQDNPEWKNYPIKMVFSNAAGQYVSDVHIALSNAKGGLVGEWDCAAPWALLDLPVGQYRVKAMLNDTGAVRTAMVHSNGEMLAAGAPDNPVQKSIGIQFSLPANE